MREVGEPAHPEGPRHVHRDDAEQGDVPRITRFQGLNDGLAASESGHLRCAKSDRLSVKTRERRLRDKWSPRGREQRTGKEGSVHEPEGL